MPLYDYDCDACGRRFEAIHGVYGDPPTACPLCGSGPVRKAIGAPAVHYKGSGWAKKERRPKPASTTSSPADGGEGSTDSSGEADSATKEPKPPASKSGSTGSTPSPSSTANPD